MDATITGEIGETKLRSGRIVASLAALISFLRGLPWFVSGRPRTPLRVLCLMAFDTVHVLRNSRRLPSHKLQTLASLLDFGACVNDFYDDNNFSRQEYRATRRLLEKAQTGVAVHEYLSRLRDLENRRPAPGGEYPQHQKVQSYRESVIRLSLGMIAATSLDHLTIEDGIRSTHHDGDLGMLYQIVMLCQIIDDVLDFAKDTADGLPSFLTAHTSPSRALILTREAATHYADPSDLPCLPQVFPFRVALWGIAVITKMAIMYGHWRLKLQAIRKRWALKKIANYGRSYDV